MAKTPTKSPHTVLCSFWASAAHAIASYDLLIGAEVFSGSRTMQMDPLMELFRA